MEISNLQRLIYYKNLGHSARVISLNPIGAGAELYERAGIQVTGCEYLGKFGLLSHHKLRRIVKLFSADVIFITGASLSSCLAASIHDVPRVLFVHYHHGPTWAERFKWRFFYRNFSKIFNRIAFCTDFIRREAEEIFPNIQKISLTVRNVFEIPSFNELSDQSTARRRLCLPVGVPIIGNAGWFIKRKRFDLLLKVASLIKRDIPELQIALAGGGALEPDLRKLAEELGLSRNVHWLGWLNDMKDFYRSLNVLVFNSNFDALGRTPIEAMAHNIPVVASVTYGGLSEAIIHGENGYLLSNHDIPKLASYIFSLLNNEELRIDISQQGRDWVINNHSLEQISSQLKNLLSGVM